MAADVRLPPGFELEGPQAGTNLPPGFELESPSGAPNAANQSIFQNALDEIKAIPGSVSGMAGKVSDTAQDALAALNGEGTDPIKQDLLSAGNAVYNALPHPKGTEGTLSGFVGPWSAGYLGKYEHPLQELHDRPLGVVGDVATVAAPFLGGEAAAADATKAAAVPAGVSKIDQIADYLGKKFDEFGQTQTAKALGARGADLNPENIARTRQIGEMAHDQGVVGPFTTSQGMAQRLNDLEQRSVGDFSEPIKTIDAAGIRASSGSQVAQQIKDQLWAKQRGFADLPPEVQAKLRAGIPTNSDWDKVASKINAAAANADIYGSEPMSFSSQQNLKRFAQNVGNFDSEARALKIPKQASGVIRQDLENNVSAASDLLGKPELADQYKAGNARYGLISDAQDMLGAKMGKDAGRSAMGFGDMAAAGTGEVVGGPVGGALGYTAKKLLQNFGNQVGGWTTQHLADAVRSTPQMFGRYAPVLQQAAERGDEALVATNFVLQQRDPEYQQIMAGLRDTQ